MTNSKLFRHPLPKPQKGQKATLAIFITLAGQVLIQGHTTLSPSSHRSRILRNAQALLARLAWVPWG
ncbi:MAG: hypothetical protein KatS3mg071_1959 [Meiothermus sp.]|nr:MAG: hypothetical protein KatS3mg071_1959 [Meiothermus sp.]